MANGRQKNHTQVIATLTSSQGRRSANRTIDSSTQTSILLLALGQKVNVLLSAREKLIHQLLHNPPSPTILAAVIQDIDAEVNLCLMVVQSIDANNPIQFPSSQQITALSDAVRALGNATAAGAATAALIPAIANVIATFPA